MGMERHEKEGEKRSNLNITQSIYNYERVERHD
jgi:hypothetical protein